MANPWDADPIVEPAPTAQAAGAMPWESDPIVDEGPGLDIDIVGGVRESEVGNANDSDFARMISGQPAPEGGFLRDVGMGARSVIQGAGGLFGALGGDAANYYLVPGEQPTYREAAAGLADRLGLPSPQTSRERVMGDVGEALTGTGLTMGAGGAVAGLAPRVSQFLTAQPGLQTVSTATGAGAAGVTRETGGGTGAQIAAGLAGGLTPAAVSAGIPAAVRGAIRGGEAGRQRVADNIQDFQRLGTMPSVGQATQGRFMQGAENLLGGAPTSAGVINRFAERQAEDIGTGLQRIANDFYRNPSAERAGRAIERGVDAFNHNVGAMRRALYWQADQYIPDTVQTPMRNTLRTITDLTTPDPQAAATTGGLIQPGIAALRQNLDADLAANGGQLTYGALRRIRSDIGEQIGNASPLNPPADLRELNRLYSALSDDMRDAARSQGPEAVAAATRANNYTRASAQRLDAIRRVVDKAGGGEAIYRAAMSGTKDGGTTLRSVMQSLPPSGQRAVTAAVIRRMGMANSGGQDAAGEVFSAKTFLRKWNDVSPEAKRALFNRHGPQFSADMDRIASVAQNISEGSQVLANPSGTANRAAAYTYGASLAASLLDPSMTATGSLVAGGIGANLWARAMTNPRFVAWLAQQTRTPVGALPAQMNVLRGIAERQKEPELAEIADLIEQSYQAQQQEPQAQ